VAPKDAYCTLEYLMNGCVTYCDGAQLEKPTPFLQSSLRIIEQQIGYIYTIPSLTTAITTCHIMNDGYKQCEVVIG
jgi:hypothetical protein